MTDHGLERFCRAEGMPDARTVYRWPEAFYNGPLSKICLEHLFFVCRKRPDWMSTTRFDILAKMPEGSRKEDAPKLLQSLLKERFKLTAHHTSPSSAAKMTGND